MYNLPAIQFNFADTAIFANVAGIDTFVLSNVFYHNSLDICQIYVQLRISHKVWKRAYMVLTRLMLKLD